MKITALLALLLITACLKDETISGVTSENEIWHLAQFNETPISSEITITFPAKGEISGKAPCNRYKANQDAPLPWFDAGPILATKRACPDLQLEARYFAALKQATMIERTGKTLLLTGDGLTLEFRLK